MRKLLVILVAMVVSGLFSGCGGGCDKAIETATIAKLKSDLNGRRDGHITDVKIVRCEEARPSQMFIAMFNPTKTYCLLCQYIHHKPKQNPKLAISPYIAHFTQSGSVKVLSAYQEFWDANCSFPRKSIE